MDKELRVFKLTKKTYICTKKKKQLNKDWSKAQSSKPVARRMVMVGEGGGGFCFSVLNYKT